jgi:hypothetical protein
MTLLEICQWLDQTPLSMGIHESAWWYSILETLHTLGIVLVAGTIVLVDLRLLGHGLRRVPVSQVIGYVVPWTLCGFVFMAISGCLLLSSEAVTCYNSPFFRIKVVLLALAGVNALVFHLTVYRDAPTWDPKAPAPARARMAGLASLILWAGIVAAGRAVAYGPGYGL